MLPATILAKKRDGHALSEEEIRFLIEGFVAGTIADYQMTAFAMAVLLRGMNAQETAALTLAMLNSGERLPRSSDGPPRVDKHSTGGLGDKVSLVLAPLLACHEVHVPMISGRGLGLTGGTLDKLEAIPGYRCWLDERQREQQLQAIGCFIVGASDKIAPADRRLYALRDVTATVASIPLITASILAKKLAASLDALVMDVKVGSGAFMQDTTQARALADSLVQTGAQAGLPTTALLSDMDQPLGQAVGNAIEVNETLALLQGDGPAEVNELTVALGARVLVDVGRYDSLAQATAALGGSLRSGAARQRFEQWIAAQGGRLSSPLPLAPGRDVLATRDGFVDAIDCQSIGRCVVEMGGGRRQAGDTIDPSVGVRVQVRIGDRVEKGQPLFTLHARAGAESFAEVLGGAVSLVEHRVAARPLVIDTLPATTLTATTPAAPAASPPHAWHVPSREPSVPAEQAPAKQAPAEQSSEPPPPAAERVAIAPECIERLVQAALEARGIAHAPYSQFRVGAALLSADGEVFVGCNVENVSFSLTVCAERVAAVSAVASQSRSWTAIAIASPGGVTPCGACRQFLAEFGNDLQVICVDAVTATRTQHTLSSLLPHAFDRHALDPLQTRLPPQ